ncbi:MAG: hypothetical protein ACKORG_09330 [Actinomycetota bacterium]
MAEAIGRDEMPVTHTCLVDAKIRPVVILQGRPRGSLPDYAALKLTRLAKLSSAERDRVRAHASPDRLYLPEDPDRYGLPTENAIDVNSLVRVHRDAIVAVAGRLDAHQVTTLGHKLAAALDIDLRGPIREGVMVHLEAMRRDIATARPERPSDLG